MAEVEQIQYEDIPHSIKFLKHIFGTKQVTLETDNDSNTVDYYIHAMDYLAELLFIPTKRQPALLLFSECGGTGKTLFFKWLQCLMGDYRANIEYGDTFYNLGNRAGPSLYMLDEYRIFDQSCMAHLKEYQTAEHHFQYFHSHKETVPNRTNIMLTSNDVHAVKSLMQKKPRHIWCVEVGNPININVNLAHDLRSEAAKFITFLFQHYAQRMIDGDLVPHVAEQLAGIPNR